jgi:hypothetical protein
VSKMGLRRLRSPDQNQEEVPRHRHRHGQTDRRHAAMQQLRIVALGLSTGRQEMVLERWANPKLSRRTCTCEYGLQSWRGDSAGVAKRPRELNLPSKSRTLTRIVWCVSQERVDPEGGAGKNRLGSMGFQVAKTVAQVEVLSVLRELRTLQRKD